MLQLYRDFLRAAASKPPERRAGIVAAVRAGFKVGRGRAGGLDPVAGKHVDFAQGIRKDRAPCASGKEEARDGSEPGVPRGPHRRSQLATPLGCRASLF